MCGLVGIISSLPLTAAHVTQFKKLLILDQIRGKDSVGIISEKPTGIEYEKSVIDPVSFLEHRRVGPLLTGARALVGHNRAATKGGVSTNNAHPFHHGGVTLVHNGTLTTNAVTTPYFTVDSESICYALSQVEPENAKDVLEKLEGAYALIWYDERDSSWNIAKNDERPLHWMRSESGNTYWVSSEAGILYAATSLDMDIQPDKHIFKVPNDRIHKITIDKAALNVEVVNFQPKKPKYTPIQYTTGGKQTGTNSTTTSRRAVSDPQEDFKTYIGSPGWYPVEIDKIIPSQNPSNQHLHGWVDCEPYCKVIIWNADKTIKMGDTLEVELKSLYLGQYDNHHAKQNPAMATLTGTRYRKAFAPKKESPHIEQCTCCGGVFDVSTELALLSDGEYICRSCYGSDPTFQAYAHQVGIIRDFKL